MNSQPLSSSHMMQNLRQIPRAVLQWHVCHLHQQHHALHSGAFRLLAAPVASAAAQAPAQVPAPISPVQQSQQKRHAGNAAVETLLGNMAKEIGGNEEPALPPDLSPMHLCNAAHVVEAVPAAHAGPCTCPAGIPKVVLKRDKARLFKGGHPMVFSGAVDRVVGKQPRKGDAVLVTDGAETALAWGVYNGSSMFRVRSVSARHTASLYVCAQHVILEVRLAAALTLPIKLQSNARAVVRGWQSTSEPPAECAACVLTQPAEAGRASAPQVNAWSGIVLTSRPHSVKCEHLTQLSCCPGSASKTASAPVDADLNPCAEHAASNVINRHRPPVPAAWLSWGVIWATIA